MDQNPGDLLPAKAPQPVAVQGFGDRLQALFRFPNGYGASAIQDRGVQVRSYGGADGLWELAVIAWDGDGDDDWTVTYDTPITPIRDVLGWLSGDDAAELLAHIAELPERRP